MKIKGMLTIGLVAGVLALASKGFAAGNKGVIEVSAAVSPRLSQATVRQERLLEITPENIAKGYVDVSVGTILRVKSNDRNGYFLRFQVNGFLVREALVNINGRVVSVSNGPGLIRQSFPGSNGETLQIAYRLYLAPQTKPGAYPWPIAVEASLI